MDYSKMKKTQLIEEIEALQGKVAELERAEAERKRAGEALRESEERYRTLVENADDVIFMIDSELRLVSANSLLFEHLEKDETEILGKTLFDFMPRHIAENAQSRVKEVIETKSSVSYELETVIPSGTFWINVRLSPVFDDQGNVVHFLGISRDITERKKTEEELRLQSEVLRNMTEGVLLTRSSDRKMIYANPRFEEMFGYGPGELIGKNVTILNAPGEQTSEEVAKEIIKHLDENGVWYGQVSNIKKDGTHFWSQASISEFEHPVYGKVDVNVLEDITERKRAEEEIRQRTAQLEALREVSLELTTQLDLDALLHSVVSRAVELLGGVSGSLYLYRPDRDALELTVSVGIEPTPSSGIFLHRGEGLAGKILETGESIIVDDYQQWEGRATVWEGYPFAAAVGMPVRWGEEFLGVLDVDADPLHTFSPADIELLNLFATQAAIAIRNARLYQAAQKEILERKRAEEEIRQLGQLQESIIDNANVWLNVLDEKANVAIWNKAAEEISGYSREEVVGHSKVWEWLYLDEEYRREVVAEAIAIIEEGEEERDVETNIRRKDGQTRVISWNSRNLLDEKGNPVGSIALGRDITERKRAEEEIERLAKFPSESPNPVLRVAQDGTVLYSNKASLSLLNVWGCQEGQPLPDDWREFTSDALSAGSSRGADVQVEGRVLSLTFAPVVDADYVNVYGLDITERRRAEEMKDNLIRDVSHELKTPLAKMQMSVEQLMETVGTPSIDRQKVARVSEIVSGNVQRLQSTVSSILDLSSLESGRTLYHKTRVQPEKLIRQAMVDMQPLAEAKGLELAAELPEGLPQIEGDREKLLRVLTNLVDNAVKFTDQGKIVISAKMKKAHEIEIAVSDSGRGIPRENLDRAFERFWQENPSIPGAGIGLAICKTIVEAHGGKIWAESARGGQGATVRFTLPVG